MVGKLFYMEYSKLSITEILSVFWLLLLQVNLIILFSLKQIGVKCSVWSVVSITGLLLLDN